jgi:hypothetical protein
MGTTRFLFRWPSLLIAGLSLGLLRLFGRLFSASRLRPLLVTVSPAAPRERPQRHAAFVVSLGLRASVSAFVLCVVMVSLGRLLPQASFACQLGLLLGAVGVQQAIGSGHADRAGEIQMLLLLGAQRRHVFRMLMIESLVVAIVSGGIAAVLGAILARSWLPAGGQIENHLLLALQLWPAMIALLVAGNMVPAWRAVRASLAHAMAGPTLAPRQVHRRDSRVADLLGLLVVTAAWLPLGSSVHGDVLGTVLALLGCQLAVALLLPCHPGPGEPGGRLRTSVPWLKRVVRSQGPGPRGSERSSTSGTLRT